MITPNSSPYSVNNRAVAISGAVLVLGGRALLASGLYLPGFIVSLVGDGCWLYYGVATKQWSLAILAMSLLVIDPIGAYRQ